MNQYTWEKIPLGTYAAIDALLRHPASNEMQRDITILSMITGKPERYYEEEIHLTQLSKELQKLRAFLGIELQAKYTPKFKVKGRKFKVSETLDEYNVGQLEGISLLKLTPENFAEKSGLCMAILCKEKKGLRFWRDELSLEQKQKLFEESMPTSVVIGIVQFFFVCSQALLPIVLEKVERETKQMIDQMKKDNPISEQRR